MILLYTGVGHLYNPDNISYIEFIEVNNIRVYFNGGHCLPLLRSVADKVIKDLLEKVPDILREGFAVEELV